MLSISRLPNHGFFKLKSCLVHLKHFGDSVPMTASSKSLSFEAVLPTHSLPARSTSCSLVLNEVCDTLVLGEGQGEWEGDGQGEVAGLAKSSSDELPAARLARRQRGLHHSLWVERCMSFLALCSLRAEWNSTKVKKVLKAGKYGSQVSCKQSISPRASALGLLEEMVRVTMRCEREESVWIRVSQWARSFKTLLMICITSEALSTGLLNSQRKNTF